MSNVFGFVPKEAGGLSKKLLAEYVTVDTAQTITGEKTFTSDLVCMQDITTDTVVFDDTTFQITAYKSLTPGTYTNADITVDSFGAISGIASGIGGNFMTTDTEQTITANKTWSGNSTFTNQINYRYGGNVTVLTSLTAPYASIYTPIHPSGGPVYVPDPTPSLQGLRILFKRTANTVQFAFRVNPNQTVFVPFNTTTLTDNVTIASNQFQCELFYLSDRILQMNMV